MWGHRFKSHYHQQNVQLLSWYFQQEQPTQGITGTDDKDICVCVCVHMLKSIYTAMYVCTCTVCACVLGGCTLILIVFLYHFPPIFWEGSLHWTWGSLMALMGQKVNYGNAPASLSPLLLSRLGSQKCATVPRSSCFCVKCFNHWALSLTLHK